jgi:hypothetical protein
LGRALSDEEAIGIQTYLPHEAPSPDRQRALAEALRQHFAEIDEKAKNVPDDEAEEILEEAIRSVRPGYRAVR